MLARKLLPQIALVLLAALASPSPAAGKEKAGWALTSARVVDPGETVRLPADAETGFPGGTLTAGAVLEAQAKATGGPLVMAGTFRLVFSAFRPDADLPGQRAGAWAVEGKWTLVDAKADRKALSSRHNPYLVEGRLKAALPLNPALDGAAWAGTATLPTAIAAGKWARAREGSLSLDGAGRGALSLDVSFIASK